MALGQRDPMALGQRDPMALGQRDPELNLDLSISFIEEILILLKYHENYDKILRLLGIETIEDIYKTETTNNEYKYIIYIFCYIIQNIINKIGNPLHKPYILQFKDFELVFKYITSAAYIEDKRTESVDLSRFTFTKEKFKGYIYDKKLNTIDIIHNTHITDVLFYNFDRFCVELKMFDLLFSYLNKPEFRFLKFNIVIILIDYLNKQVEKKSEEAIKTLVEYFYFNDYFNIDTINIKKLDNLLLFDIKYTNILELLNDTPIAKYDTIFINKSVFYTNLKFYVNFSLCRRFWICAVIRVSLRKNAMYY
jgi:hypothetical protein